MWDCVLCDHCFGDGGDREDKRENMTGVQSHLQVKIYRVGLTVSDTRVYF